jgi:hypothetical protein
LKTNHPMKLLCFLLKSFSVAHVVVTIERKSFEKEVRPFTNNYYRAFNIRRIKKLV